MALKDRTKHMFARKFESMLEEMPLNKIKVKDLCARCRTTPQVFYYHFHDKYELVAWIYMRDLQENLEFGNGYTVQNTINEWEFLERRRSFYWKFFTDPTYYNGVAYMRETTANIMKDAMRLYLGKDEIPSETLAWIHFSSHGLVGLLQDWILGNINLTAREMGEFAITLYRDDILQALNAYYLAQTKLPGVDIVH